MSFDLSSQNMNAAALLAISLTLFIGSMVSYGLFNNKGCSDSTPNGNFQKCNGVNIFISVLLFGVAAGIYFGKVELSEMNLIALAGIVSLVLFITGMIQCAALNNSVSCDASVLSTLKNWNKLVWVMAIISMVLSGYIYYKMYNEEQALLKFKYFLRK